MPNWCENELTVSGKPQTVKSLFDKIEPTRYEEYGSEYFHLIDTLYPIPEELQNTISPRLIVADEDALRRQIELADDKDEAARRILTRAESERLIAVYGAHDWYDWCIQHWGTKWGDAETRLRREGERILHIDFNSAWSPPVEAILHISTLYPTLRFHLRFWEGGMAFRGVRRIKNGRILYWIDASYQGRRGG